MYVTRLRLRNFRNYERLDAELSPGFHVLLGNNAQGKTNLLECLYLLATLRSFRGVGGAQMVQHGQKGYFVGAEVRSTDSHEIRIYWSQAERRLQLDSQPVRKLSEYLGVVRMVVFCTEDLLLVKGPAQARRRFLDLLLSQADRAYLPLLQRYTHALRSRNVLLKQRVPDEAAVDSYSRELVKVGEELIRRRTSLIPQLEPLVQQAGQRISAGVESLRLLYQSSVKGDFALALARQRDRERQLRVTLVGPHRDDLLLLLDDRSAAQFGSEGQKRSLAIALKMAQAEYLAGLLGFPPILLIDDVMGELDARRRSGFLPLLERAQEGRGQVFMTCTEENWPTELGASFHRWEVAAGHLRPLR